MRLLLLACLLGACGKSPPSEDSRRPRVSVTVDLGPKGETPPERVRVDTLGETTTARIVERSGITLAIASIPDAFGKGANATVLVTRRCLSDLVPGFQKNLLYFWTVALVVGERCAGDTPKTLGAATLIARGEASRATISFDQRTHAFLRVEPSP